MLKLFRIHNDSYIISTHKGSIACNRIEAVVTLESIGVPKESISDALTDLQALDHHVAEFGTIFKSYMYTQRIAVNTERDVPRLWQ